MNVFFYDKTFEGLLSAVFDAYTNKSFPAALLGLGNIPPLMAQMQYTVTNSMEKAGRVFSGLKKRLSPKAVQEIFLAWLSEEEGSDFLLFQYMRLIFDSGKSREADYSNSAILDVHMLARKVNCERHHLQGFIRFQKIKEGIYCAFIKPRHNVLPLLLRHFAERYSDQRWVIHDLKRHYGIMFEGDGFKEINLDENMVDNGRLETHLLAEGEELTQNLWKEYFSATSIRERTNVRLQARFMPRRYWTYLTEKQ